MVKPGETFNCSMQLIYSNGQNFQFMVDFGDSSYQFVNISNSVIYLYKKYSMVTFNPVIFTTLYTNQTKQVQITG